MQRTVLTEFQVKNFKSIRDLRLEPGRVTVLIGENGSGKSNILEALAFAGAAVAGKLDHEFLASRGIRVPTPRFMRNAFRDDADPSIRFVADMDGESATFEVTSKSQKASDPWAVVIEEVTSILPSGDSISKSKDFQDITERTLQGIDAPGTKEELATLAGSVLARMMLLQSLRSLAAFLIYSPENTALRNFEQEGQILPLGVKGEGLFQLLKTMSADESAMAELRDNLRLLDWFEDIRLTSDLAPYERRLHIRDRYLAASEGKPLEYFDQRSANEGFLFLLFYFALVISPDTPKLFAIDNIDASLNPKLCTELMRRLVALAAKHDKQILITTHNPAILDGLDLNDPDQRLYTVHRNSKGHTKARRVAAPKPVGDEPPVKLSEAFLRGLLGGLPQNF